MSDNRSLIRRYHEQTKHSIQAYAKGPEYLDWDQQPDPFRRFQGSSVVPLPLVPAEPNTNPTNSLNQLQLAQLLQLSLGLSCWKEFGPDRWALRCNPSSGNLHPTEGYVIANQIDGLEDGVYHYAVYQHALEKRASFVENRQQSQLLIGLSSIFWREAWKYGERAYRYVQLDVGHAIGAIYYAAQSLGLKVALVSATDQAISQLLGLDRPSDFAQAETEHPDVLLQIVPLEQDFVALQLPKTQYWQGQANHLGGLPYYHWDIIEQVAEAGLCNPAQTEPLISKGIGYPDNGRFKDRAFLQQIIQQRRSAQAFGGKMSTMELPDFYSLLESIIKPSTTHDRTADSLTKAIHLVLFVHRVSELAPGIYILPSSASAVAALQAAMLSDFGWQTPDNCPAHIPLFCLYQGDVRKIARSLSCYQEIASSSAFSISMLAEYDNALNEGAHRYKQLYWEAGLLGQSLYLLAETFGLQGTGIGCFFDDSVHELLGLEDQRFQSLYHFTIGKAKPDQRIQSFAPYQHLSAINS